MSQIDTGPGTGGDDDAELVPGLRRHFESLDAAEPPPAFASSFDRARALHQAQAPERRQPIWRWVGLAAALVLAVLLLPLSQQFPTAAPGVVPDTPLLLAELGRSTHWRAPSDRWLVSTPILPAQGIPDLDHWTYEVKTWP